MYILKFRTNLDRYSHANVSYDLFDGAPIPRVGEMVKVVKTNQTPFDELAVVSVKYTYGKSRSSDRTDVVVTIELHYSEMQHKEGKAYDLDLY